MKIVSSNVAMISPGTLASRSRFLPNDVWRAFINLQAGIICLNEIRPGCISTDWSAQLSQFHGVSYDFFIPSSESYVALAVRSNRVEVTLRADVPQSTRAATWLIRFPEQLDDTITNISVDTISITVVYAPVTPRDRLYFFEDELSQIVRDLHANQHTTQQEGIVPYLLTGDFNDYPSLLDVQTDHVQGDTAQRHWGTALQGILLDTTTVDVWRERNPDEMVFSFLFHNTSDGSVSKRRLDNTLCSESLLKCLKDITYTDGPLSPALDHSAMVLTIVAKSVMTKLHGRWRLHPSLLMSSAYVAAATTFSKDFDLREHRSTPRGYITNLLWAVQHFSIRYLTTTKEGYRQKASLIAHDINTEAVQELAMNHSSNISVDDRSVTSSYATIKSYAESYKLDVARIETSRRKRLQNEERRPTAFTREAIFQSKGSVVQIPKLDDPLGIGSSTSESGLIRSRIANFYEALHTPDDVAFRNTTYKEEVDAFLSMSVKPGTLKEGIGKATRNSIQVDMDVEEVFAATKKANMASAAGNSGIPYRFWLIFHSIFGARLVALANYMMKGGELGQSDPIIPVTILYKRGTRSDIRNYRPISLIDTHLRILLIAITTRLGKAFTRIIPDKQTAFIPKRSIIMNVLTVILALEWGGPSLSTNTSTVFPD